MFFTYLRRELRRRRRQSLVVALGLALGIGLVVTVSAVSNGVKTAQNSVLHSLYGVGTDMTVTETAARGSGNGRQSFGFQGPQAGGGSGTKTATTNTDNLRLAFGSAAISTSTLTTVKNVGGVSKAVGSLTLTDVNVSGTVSQQQNNSTTGGTDRPGGTTRSFGGPASGDFSFNSTTIDGVDTGDLSLGPMSGLSISSGRGLTAADATAYDAVVSSSYANSSSLKLGGTVTFGGKAFTIVGIAGGDSSTVSAYIPLGIAQTLASQSGKVSTIYVSATSATRINTIAATIQKDVPAATVTTSADLADSVSGSLASTASLTDNLGKWLSIAVLAAAFLLAALFTMSAVSRRVREFGTLKALGWRTRRIVGQVMGEALVQGIIGGALGIGIGLLGAFIVDKVAPGLTASAGTNNAGSVFGGPGGPGGRAAQAADSVIVHLTAPVTLTAVGLAVLLAVAGGLLAGMVGGWRAGRLRPAAALRRVD
jgi:putative ABC transport system permease protein